MSNFFLIIIIIIIIIIISILLLSLKSSHGELPIKFVLYCIEDKSSQTDKLSPTITYKFGVREFVSGLNSVNLEAHNLSQSESSLEKILSQEARRNIMSVFCYLIRSTHYLTYRNQNPSHLYRNSVGLAIKCGRLWRFEVIKYYNRVTPCQGNLF